METLPEVKIKEINTKIGKMFICALKGKLFVSLTNEQRLRELIKEYYNES